MLWIVVLMRERHPIDAVWAWTRHKELLQIVAASAWPEVVIAEIGDELFPTIEHREAIRT